MKVLTDKTAAALVRLLRERPALPPRRVRIAHGGDDGGAPIFLECRTFGGQDASTGDPILVLRVYIGRSGNYPASIRINGKPAPLDISPSDVDSAGWLELGPVEDISAVWLVPDALPQRSPQTYEDAANWGSVAIRFRFDVDGTVSSPGSTPARAPDANWPRWLHPLFVCRVDGGKITQGVIGGADISIEVGDADGTHNGYGAAQNGVSGQPGGFCSIEQAGRLQLYRFANPILITPETLDAGGTMLVIRQGPSPSGAAPARVVYADWQAIRQYLVQQYGFDMDAWLAQNLDALATAIANSLSNGDRDSWWRQGDGTDTCYGIAIGDSSKDAVIQLDNRKLLDNWGTTGDFQVDGDFDVTGDADIAGAVDAMGFGNFGAGLTTMGDLDVDGRATIDGNLTVGGDISATGDVSAAVANVSELNTSSDANVGGNLATTGDATVGGDISATGELSGATLKVGGNIYAPVQITYTDGNGSPQTITILKKQ